MHLKPVALCVRLSHDLRFICISLTNILIHMRAGVLSPHRIHGGSIFRRSALGEIRLRPDSLKASASFIRDSVPSLTKKAHRSSRFLF